MRYCFDKVYESEKANEIEDKVEATLIRLYDPYLLYYSSDVGASCNLSQISNEMDFDDLDFDDLDRYIF